MPEADPRSRAQARSAKKRKTVRVPPLRKPAEPISYTKIRLLKQQPPIPTEPAENDRLLTKRELLDRVKLSYVQVWKLMRAGTFPRSRAIGGKLVWLESEINEWIRALPRTALKGDED